MTNINQFIIAAVFTSLLTPLTITSQIESQVPVEISVNNLKSDKGNIVVSIFKSDKSFQTEIPDEEQSFPKKKHLTNGIFKTTVHLPPGTYGIAVLDDVNEDRKMNYSLFGVPTEGYGFSNFDHTGYSKPKFSNFSFKIFKGKKILKSIKLRYF